MGLAGARRGRIVAWLLLGVLVQRMVWLEQLHHPMWQALALAAAFLLAGVALTGLLLPGAWLGVAAYVGLRSASAAKLHYLQEPLRAADVLTFGAEEGLELFTQYWGLALAAAGGLLALGAGWLWLRRRSSRMRGRYRLGVLALAAGLWVGVVRSLAGLELGEASPQSTSALNFISTFHDEPPQLLAPGPPWPRAAEVACPVNPPHVLVALQESTYLPPALQADAAARPFYSGNAWAGPLRSRVIGGQTHLSEFTFLTGLPHTALKGENSYPQVPLLGRIHGHLGRWLAQCGYETTFLHATQPHFRNTTRWYTSLGFDHVIGARELGFTDWRVPDRVMFDKVLARVDRLGKGRPQFVLVKTIDRHGPYQRDDPRRDYMARLAAGVTDDAWMRAQIAQRQPPADAVGRPWLWAWFGDHRPSAIDVGGSDRWLTWGVIDWPGRAAPAVVPSPTLDLAFFGERLLQEAGVRVNPLSQRMHALMQVCPGDYDACPQPLREAWVRDYIDIGGYGSRGLEFAPRTAHQENKP